MKFLSGKSLALLAILSLLIIGLTFGQESKLSLIKVDGKYFKNEKGEKLIFRGFNISDPDKLQKSGHWSKSYFEMAKTWGANTIRIPVHPSAWRSRGQENYMALLDNAVKWAAELGLYVIIDWHSIGNLRTEKFQSANYNTTLKETQDFWSLISKHFKGNHTAAFYEIFNEPTTSNNTLGTCTWKEWKDISENIIKIILNNNPEAIPLVAGFDWAYDLTPVATDPINIPGICYVSHPYPEKRSQPWEPKWEKDFGFVADKYPVFATEFGFALPDEIGYEIPCRADEVYGKLITDYFDKKGISWMVWDFDPDWGPTMFKDWNYTPTRQGTFFKSILKKYSLK
jgi:aryl-phospho-beta-D-glucosidase BglC (GH1 family)